MSIASDSSGQYLAAVANYEGIYTNNNSGAGSWTKTSAPYLSWTAIASDSTGQYLAAVADGGGIYTNTNYGSESWTLAPSVPTYFSWRYI